MYMTVKLLCMKDSGILVDEYCGDGEAMFKKF